jgi:hypothetical protein
MSCPLVIHVFLLFGGGGMFMGGLITAVGVFALSSLVVLGIFAVGRFRSASRADGMGSAASSSLIGVATVAGGVPGRNRLR